MQKSDIQIIQFDPDDYYITVVELILANWDIKLTGSAVDLPTSNNLIQQIETKKIKPNIAIVEAHMGNSEEDGKKIATKLRQLLPSIKIVGYATFETKDWADYEAIKGLKDPKATIIEILSEITQLKIEPSGKINFRED